MSPAHKSLHLYQQGPNPMSQAHIIIPVPTGTKSCLTTTRCINKGQNLHGTPQQARKTITAKIGDKIRNLWIPDPQAPGSKQHHFLHITSTFGFQNHKHLLHITSTFGFQIYKHLLHINSTFGFQIHKHLARTRPFKLVIFTTTSDAGCTD